jgi:perosamine synthetase
MKVPVNRPWFHGNEEKYLAECIETGWISSEGPFIRKLEDAVRVKVDRAFGIAVSSGSAALDIAITAIGLEKGDEVIMPTFSIISPAFSVLRAGAVPVLVDADPTTWNMDVSAIEDKITSRTRAILVVHIYGLPVDMDPVLDLCKKYSLKLIEDAAEMHGQTYKGKPCGSFGDISVFSFYPNKLVTTGEGGMLLTNDPALAERCRKLRNLGFEENGRRFVHYEFGWNYRMTNMQAALGMAQLEYWDDHLVKKKAIGKRYRQAVQSLPNLRGQAHQCDYAENVYWVFGIVMESQHQADKMTAFLQENGVGTRPFFWCMHEQPVFNNLGLFPNERYPVAEELARNGFYIPSGLGVTNEEIDHVIGMIKSFSN